MSQTYGIFFKPMLGEFGWTRAVTAGARSLAAGVAGLLGVVAGGLTDRFGPRRVVLVFGSLLGLGFLLMSQISTLWQFYAVYGIVVGIGLSAAIIPTLTTVARWFVKRRGLMTGIVQAGGGVGGMILPPVAGWLIITYNWRSAYFTLGIAALLFILLSVLFLRRDPGQIGQLPYGTDEALRRGSGSQGSPPQMREFSIGEAIRTDQFWVLSMILFGFGFCRSATLVHIAVYATDLGFSLIVGANVLAIMNGTSIVARIGMGRLADVIGNRQTFMIGYVIMAAALLWVQVTDELWTLYLFAATFGFSWGALAVIRMPLIAEIFGLGSLGTILGTLEFGAQIGAITGPLLAGWLFDVTGAYTIVFFVAAAIAMIGLVLLMVLRPTVGMAGPQQ
jgi:MFS family permease